MPEKLTFVCNSRTLPVTFSSVSLNQLVGRSIHALSVLWWKENEVAVSSKSTGTVT